MSWPDPARRGRKMRHGERIEGFSQVPLGWSPLMRQWLALSTPHQDSEWQAATVSGDERVALSAVKAIRVEDLSSLDEHRTSTQGTSVWHDLRFRGGGELRFGVAEDGRIAALSVQGLSCRLQAGGVLVAVVPREQWWSNAGQAPRLAGPPRPQLSTAPCLLQPLHPAAPPRSPLRPLGLHTASAALPDQVRVPPSRARPSDRPGGLAGRFNPYSG